MLEPVCSNIVVHLSCIGVVYLCECTRVVMAAPGCNCASVTLRLCGYGCMGWLYQCVRIRAYVTVNIGL